MDEAEILKHFRRNSDGSWSCIEPIRIGGVPIGLGITIHSNVKLGSVSIREMLNKLAVKHPNAVKT